MSKVEIVLQREGQDNKGVISIRVKDREARLLTCLKPGSPSAMISRW
jgi:hypothetical protein